MNANAAASSTAHAAAASTSVFVERYFTVWVALCIVAGVALGHWLPTDPLDRHVSGLILLAAAPCTAISFVWSRQPHRHPLFTPSQLARHDTIMVFALAPIVVQVVNGRRGWHERGITKGVPA